MMFTYRGVIHGVIRAMYIPDKFVYTSADASFTNIFEQETKIKIGSEVEFVVYEIVYSTDNEMELFSALAM